ncbi:calnexin-like isoform X2 [Denticeps clupeoides]|uniref:calnexin-like isoform X2 n=1 Tax=Denticeps clupeoides TaxID=299321 RepID=UPI0010A4C07C|nr:calnexin-like isoform X2 [Denticeps clupeoides]
MWNFDAMDRNNAVLLVCASLWMVALPRTEQSKTAYASTPEEAHFAETFDSDPLDRNWIRSMAVKKVDEELYNYDGQWALEEQASEQASARNRALVLKSPGRHHAISAYLRSVYSFTDKPLCLQYEVQFQKGVECGGAYIKLLTDVSSLRLESCDRPIRGEARTAARDGPQGVLHRPQPTSLHPAKGSLLEDMDPPVNPPRDILDPDDSKPESWDDRPLIPDPRATKSLDWDEETPRLIPDPSAQKPLGWLVGEEPFIPDPEARPPVDWSEEMDGAWEAPLISNPMCAEASGCGPWTPPTIPNPAYRGKWKPPMIDNPNYQGKWQPRSIPNPAYFEDLQPFRMSPVAAVGLELWSLTGGVLFDNILLCDSLDVAQRWTQDTWGQRQATLQESGVMEQLLLATVKRPWLWGVYVFTVGLPLILFVSFMWPDKRFGPPDQDYYYKKSDAPQADGLHDPEGPTALQDCGEKTMSGPRKRAQKKSDLEFKVVDTTSK